MARKRAKRVQEFPPPEVIERIPVGQKIWLADPNGIEQLWIKAKDGTVKKLRHR